jgi:hypothetical protein
LIFSPPAESSTEAAPTFPPPERRVIMAGSKSLMPAAIGSPQQLTPQSAQAVQQALPRSDTVPQP